MNFLAHLYLSFDDPKLMVGNFIGDFVKGRDFRTRYEQPIASGIELHRAIDEFTDRHRLVGSGKNRLRPKYRHYSAIIVDIFYDHYLAKNWEKFHPERLPDFAEKSYRVIEEYHHILPEETKYMIPYMIKGNWLVNYATFNGIQRALSGMARRTKFHSGMEESGDELVKYYGEFEAEFMEFFPELRSFAEKFVALKRGN